MLQSKLFTKTKKEAPSDEVSRNAELLIRGGYIHKEMAGVYAYLPLGLKVLEKIKKIIREEMNAIRSSELIMTALQKRDVWEQTGRWSDELVDIWFKTKLKDETELGLGWSHEEPIVDMLKGYIQSYKDLPVSLYQFQTKLRNELRAKSGIMRGREFVMKDMYSMHASSDDLEKYYNEVIEAYKKIFSRIGIANDTYVTFASGGAFTKFSHEFQTICGAGEDTIYLHRAKNIAVNEEVIDEAVSELGIKREELEPVKTAEVGNIFNFGTQKTDDMGLKYVNENGIATSTYFGSYGIGVTRVMGVVVEKFSDDKGIVWPESIAPFQVHLLALGEDESVKAKATDVYEKLTAQGVEVLFDDRSGVSAGEKFADADLLGMPLRAVISKRSIEEGGIEIKKRTEEKAVVMPVEEFMNVLLKTQN